MFLLGIHPLFFLILTSKALEDCSCGESIFGLNACGGREERIVGGREAYENEIPWQVRLNECDASNFCSNCGGAIIGKRFILSAAHCFYDSKAKNVKAQVGYIHDKKASSFSRIYGIEYIKIHEGWHSNLIRNDIALLKVDEDIEFNDGVRPVCLPPGGSKNLYIGQSSVASGWGLRSEIDNYTSPYLRRTKLTILANDDKRCIKGNTVGGALYKDQLCAFGKNTDACYRDSGGPLTLVGSNHRTCTLAGVISYGNGCARQGHAGIYTRVGEYLSWIKDNTKDDECLKSTKIDFCDLRCIFGEVNGIPDELKEKNGTIQCQKGFCGFDDKSIDLCEGLNHPCNQKN
ncbi:trypsin beta [Lepeophtheirus salmonis]|uniref:trypsin beta n=1 Tax=Lepeophtheirus salmonis TaxID=72036 RepID=UPI001AE703DF|nr:tryptase-like [Lepeophtheirus salmonis]